MFNRHTSRFTKKGIISLQKAANMNTNRIPNLSPVKLSFLSVFCFLAPSPPPNWGVSSSAEAGWNHWHTHSCLTTTLWATTARLSQVWGLKGKMHWSVCMTLFWTENTSSMLITNFPQDFESTSSLITQKFTTDHIWASAMLRSPPLGGRLQQCMKSQLKRFNFGWWFCPFGSNR